MIPRLHESPGLEPSVAAWLQRLSGEGFRGDIETTLAARVAVATDNSVYEVLPQAVVLPRSASDVATVFHTLQAEGARSISVVPRGGGTGTNGQSLSSAVVVDTSRHLRGISQLDLKEETVDVEPGVVLDDLNRALAPHGYFFAPTLSPSDRATLGGMIATNACGKGSRVYGRTVDHIQELEIVLMDGTTHTVCPISMSEARSIASRNDPYGRLHRDVLSILEAHQQLIEHNWLTMPRSPSGYNLARVLSDNGQQFNLVPLICGSEGTLAVVVRARLRMTRIPTAKRLVVLRHAQFDDALASAEALVSVNPSAIETIDENILQLVRTDVLWDRVRHLLQDDGRTRAINLIEFTGTDPQQVASQVNQLLDQVARTPSACGSPIGHFVCDSPGDIASMWEVRKKGVGLLGKMKGDRRPIPFVEDTAVPPARLSEYIKDFRKILDSEGLRYGMFGHVDAGCLHVRPALNLRDPADVLRMRRISDQVAALAKSYGGVLWGEHGTGFRSEYLPQFWGPELFEAMCMVKKAFDPLGRLNPGKLAIAPGTGHPLRTIQGPLRADADRQIGTAAQEHFASTIFCNGNAQCLNSNSAVVMCPSSKVTRNRVHSPKGRAMIVKQWLRALSKTGSDAVNRLDRHEYPPDFAPSLLLEAWSRKLDPSAEHDFSHEVYEALNGCLSCKACATQCPIEVDIPQVKAEFLSLYHERYVRPLRDYLMAALEPMLFHLGRFARLLNWLLHNGLSRLILTTWAGLVDLPRLDVNGTLELRRRRQQHAFEWEQLASLSSAEKRRTVLIHQDAFTTFFEPKVLLNVTELISRLGFRVVWLPYSPNGKALHIKGFMAAFAALAARNTERLNRIARLGIPMVGIEPAVTLTYRDEYKKLLGTAVQFKVELLHEWLLGHLGEFRIPGAQAGQKREPYVFFGHCTEQTAELQTARNWQTIYDAFGLRLAQASVGCCGMCGVYGHEVTHREHSRGIFELSWSEPLARAKANAEHPVVAGFSCRHQIARFSGAHAQHPAAGLLRALESAAATPGEAGAPEL